MSALQRRLFVWLSLVPPPCVYASRISPTTSSCRWETGDFTLTHQHIKRFVKTRTISTWAHDGMLGEDAQSKEDRQKTFIHTCLYLIRMKYCSSLEELVSSFVEYGSGERHHAGNNSVNVTQWILPFHRCSRPINSPCWRSGRHETRNMNEHEKRRGRDCGRKGKVAVGVKSDDRRGYEEKEAGD